MSTVYLIAECPDLPEGEAQNVCTRALSGLLEVASIGVMDLSGDETPSADAVLCHECGKPEADEFHGLPPFQSIDPWSYHAFTTRAIR